MIINNSNLKINRLREDTNVKNLNIATEKNSSFDKLLSEKINNLSDVKFSKHAEERLKSRNINLTGQQKERINSGVNKAEEKGVKDSLVLCDNMAFVVSVKNRTVITAINGNELKDNVFTKIDGAVIV